MGMRIVVEIPYAFADYCEAIGDKPRDVILDLIGEVLDPPEPLSKDVDDGPVQAEAPPPVAPEGICRLIRDGRGLPEIAEFLREPAKKPVNRWRARLEALRRGEPPGPEAA